ncbi:hypothetical protein BATDEDRAFT_89471 [Batrachochytrium dendrobatidis JAM81]|uniref:Sorting nexin MVP1 n=2 Tax=Batrachochytrium dendrobatidis TaxID=109871 RepID=F4P4I3_BATDJ|nr:uncharacterized protein BATDEDRAFT_89471 [Batrachochytrium dendrobatidis JAM81]EGF79821.1 hypothetical protein BATDEDRAFT_89471 [Batrachochytrium dendrobatidis JAM81]OAJ39084.1 hypothetical protein BDEG_22958 [Batrachochytrium dendrobatidis JEL423]|eukprot:XP_006679691.1 hypothetical protein BATDEDRAFT_89471 [Batrachochytrium dendrobatidis JAM81]
MAFSAENDSAYGFGKGLTSPTDLGYSIPKASQTKSSLVANPWDTESTAAIHRSLNPSVNNNDSVFSAPLPRQSSLSETEQQQLRDAFSSRPTYRMPATTVLGHSVFSPVNRMIHDEVLHESSSSMESHLSAYLSPRTTPAELEQETDPWRSVAQSFDFLNGKNHPNTFNSISSSDPYNKIEELRRRSSNLQSNGNDVEFNSKPATGLSSSVPSTSDAWQDSTPTSKNIIDQRSSVQSNGKSVCLKPSVNWSDVIPRVGPHIPLPIEEFPQDTIEVAVAPERGGFVFKHINYTVTSQIRSSTVLRRYSEFWWLAEILTKRYPYRILPVLPPKKAVGVHQEFIEQRRQRLARFINFVVNHPIFRKDDMVFIFMTWNSDIQSFRNAQQISIEEEGSLLQLTDTMRQSVPLDVHDRLAAFQSSIDFQLQQIHDQCVIMQRIIHRAQDTCVDYVKYSEFLRGLAENQYVVDPNCEHHIRTGRTYRQVAGILQSTSQIYKEQAQMTLVGLIEGLRSHSEILVAFHDLLIRTDKVLSGLSVETTTKRIQLNRAKLADLANKKASTREMERLSHTIDQDQRELEFEKAQVIFIHFCVWSELQLYHRLEDQVTNLYKQHANEQILSYRKHYEIWSDLVNSPGFC